MHSTITLFAEISPRHVDIIAWCTVASHQLHNKAFCINMLVSIGRLSNGKAAVEIFTLTQALTYHELLSRDPRRLNL
jgi:hypothetical protein